MNAALTAVNLGLLVFGAIQIAPVAGVNPVVAFIFLVGTLILGFGMEKLDDFSGDAHMGEDQ